MEKVFSKKQIKSSRKIMESRKYQFQKESNDFIYDVKRDSIYKQFFASIFGFKLANKLFKHKI